MLAGCKAIASYKEREERWGMGGGGGGVKITFGRVHSDCKRRDRSSGQIHHRGGATRAPESLLGVDATRTEPNHARSVSFVSCQQLEETGWTVQQSVDCLKLRQYGQQNPHGPFKLLVASGIRIVGTMHLYHLLSHHAWRWEEIPLRAL